MNGSTPRSTESGPRPGRWIGLVLALLTGVLAAAPPPAARLYFEPAGFLNPQLSPNGRQLAVQTLHDGRHHALALVQLDDGKIRILVKHSTISVTYFEWKADDLLLLVAESDEGRQQLLSVNPATRQTNDLTRLNRERSGSVASTLPGDPDHIICPWNDGGIRRVNVRTGRPVEIDRGLPGISHWVIDGSGRVWAGIGHHDRKWTFLWRTEPGAPWQRRDWPGAHHAELFPVGVMPDGRRLVVVDRTTGDTARLAFFDLRTTATTAIFQQEEIDITTMQNWGFRREPCAAVYDAERRRRHFFLAEAEECHRRLQEALPASDLECVSFSRDDQRVIVRAASDQDPGTYYLLDRPAGKLAVIGRSRPALEPVPPAASRPFRFAASGGRPLEGRITLPRDATRPPLVVRLGPGLPGMPATHTFDPVAQFLASRGLASVRIHIRGTPGRGRALQRAGDLQLATGMVQDLADGVAWLARQGWTDPARVALWSTDAAGLVAAHALPEGPYRAFVNFNAPMFTHTYELAQLSPSDRENEELVDLLGGSAAANRYLKSLDPLRAAARWTCPGLHLYPRTADGDQLVEDGRALQAALRKTGGTHRFFDPPRLKPESDPARLLADAAEAAVAFLQQHL